MVMTFICPLTPMSDRDRISPYKITTNNIIQTNYEN